MGLVTQTAYFTGNAWLQTASGATATFAHTDQLTCSGVSIDVHVSLGGVEVAAGWNSATGSRSATTNGSGWYHIWDYNGSGQWKCRTIAYLPAKATRRTFGTVSTKSASVNVSASYEWMFCC